ncbi:hypothetical protein [Paenibacillus soyae]|uniref:Uncharacterized protein n=1 Tax=Paenibacillus soyae TaxID=2969249 RepID=A0A9X2MVA0_9BACL|nr:hypothetical protein [Paenibacillus soyae]MCR2806538.1 hypothetical protein [Paenibacillus soyae]
MLIYNLLGIIIALLLRINYKLNGMPRRDPVQEAVERYKEEMRRGEENNTL